VSEKKPIDSEATRPVWKETLARAGRVAVATAAGGLLERYQNDPRFLAITPLLSMLGKFLRLKYPKAGSWLPF